MILVAIGAVVICLLVSTAVVGNNTPDDVVERENRPELNEGDVAERPERNGDEAPQDRPDGLESPDGAERPEAPGAQEGRPGQRTVNNETVSE